MRKFKCGLCHSRGEQYTGTRKGLRDHLKEKHRILSQITNSGMGPHSIYNKQSWWITEEFI